MIIIKDTCTSYILGKKLRNCDPRVFWQLYALLPPLAGSSTTALTSRQWLGLQFKGTSSPSGQTTHKSPPRRVVSRLAAGNLTADINAVEDTAVAASASATIAAIASLAAVLRPLVRKARRTRIAPPSRKRRPTNSNCGRPTRTRGESSVNKSPVSRSK